MVLATSGGPLLCAEIAHPQDRAILTTFMGCSYSMGSFLASWITLGTLKVPSNWAWRTPSLLQCWASIVVLSVVYWIPESPRYHMNKDNYDAALKTLAYYHAEGDANDPFVQLEFTEIKTAFQLDREYKTNSRWIDLLKTKGNRHRISLVIAIAIFAQWSGNGILAYYLKLVLEEIGIKSPDQQLGINGGSKTMSLLVNFTVAFFIDRAGRRPILWWSTVGMTLFFTLLTIVTARYNQLPEDNKNANLGRAVVAIIYMYNFSYNLKTGLPLTYTTELVPSPSSSLRSR
jgi:MFS family permease